MNRKAISELFDVNIPTAARHLKNIYNEGELERDPTVSKNEIVQNEIPEIEG